VGTLLLLLLLLLQERERERERTFLVAVFLCPLTPPHLTGSPPLRQTILQANQMSVFKYEHSDWTQGFLARVVCVGEGPVEAFLTTSQSLNASMVRQREQHASAQREREREKEKGREKRDFASFPYFSLSFSFVFFCVLVMIGLQMLSYSYSTDPFEQLIACPSHPSFGPTAGTFFSTIATRHRHTDTLSHTQKLNIVFERDVEYDAHCGLHAGTITYFILVLSVETDTAMFDISIELIPNMENGLWTIFEKFVCVRDVFGVWRGVR
jgi:hypothetical protein